MRLVFGPDDLEAYAAVRDRLRLHIVAWARRRNMAVEPSLVAAALDHKHSVDGRLGHWTRTHVADALAVWFPRTVALLPDDRDAVPAALHALMGFLADRDWLDSRSDAPDALHTQVRDSTPALYDALDDERNHDLGTFWAVQMLRHGVATADPTAVAHFLQRVHAGELEIDRAALRDITHRERRERRAAVPPAAAGAPARRRRHARRRRLLRRARPSARLHPLGARGPLADPRRPDAAPRRPLRRRGARPRPLLPRTGPLGRHLPEILLLLHWARQARFVRVMQGRLVQVKSAAPLLSRPIEMWKRAFEAVGALDEHFGGAGAFGTPSLFGLTLGEAFPMLLHLLYAAGGDPIPVERFHRAVREAVNARMGCVVDDLAGDAEQRLWRRDVTALLDALEMLGAVHLEESAADGGEDHQVLVELEGRDDPDPTLVALNPDRAVGGARDARRLGRARAAGGRARRRGHRVRVRAVRTDAPRCRRRRARGLGGGPAPTHRRPGGAELPPARRGPHAPRAGAERAGPDRERRHARPRGTAAAPLGPQNRRYTPSPGVRRTALSGANMGR